jgi:tetraprenyl-beta-curcumene synthase
MSRFIVAGRRYWLQIFPRLLRERRRRLARARAIESPIVRGAAVNSISKWGNVEGAAAFAAFVPRRQRRGAMRAMVAFQVAYNQLDMLAERGLDARSSDDGGYLQELLEEHRSALAALPSSRAVRAAMRRASGRIAAFQGPGIERWAHARRVSELFWWETAAGAGSSMCVFALIAAAARPGLEQAEVRAIERAYFPWIGALHSLLDNLVDVAEDRATGQRNLIVNYGSSEQAAERMRMLAQRALRAAATLPRAREHVLILAAMASFYLSASEAGEPGAQPVAEAVLETLGWPARLCMLVFRARQALSALGRRARGEEIVDPGAGAAEDALVDTSPC